ncbi:MAG: DEAD/DEAH box helicase [Verrucomicrobiae bacterium]|nr:DEAD/DEAH box helicase [Verrucomicrobiae bacterium]
MTEDPNEPAPEAFGDAERLTLHQLRILEWKAEREARAADTKVEDEATELPQNWELTRGINLFDWQSQAIDKWFAEGHRGTMKVVTGGGKTLLALALAERIQNNEDTDVCLAVVVPTIVLMHQWYDELVDRGNLPPSAIGRLGGGHQDDFKDGRRILISVLVSASRKLPKLVSDGGIAEHLLLVVDECHRAGGADMSKVLDTPRAYSLGLSATPERDEDEPIEGEDKGYENSMVGQALGRIIFQLSYAEALEMGLIPPFTIRHFGLPLNARERNRYEQLSRSISDTRADLKNFAPADATSGNAFFRWARSSATRRGGEVGGLAVKLISDTSKRKELLYQMEARAEAVEELIREEFEQNPEGRIILFHESIAEAMRLFGRLRDAGFPAIAEHSELPDSIRESGLNLFRKGIAQVLVSVKSLIEGFNVPAVDVGIIVASSSSVRQRIQSMGRVMRRHRGKDGEERSSCIHILYARDTVDDSIYEKLDWERATGVDRNLYFQWIPGSSPIEQPGPPRSPLPGEDEIDTDSLKPGDEYLGKYEGLEFTCDTSLNVRVPDGPFADEAADVARQVIEVKRQQAGKFRITPKKHVVLVRLNEGENWVTRFVTRLNVPLTLRDEEVGADSEVDEDPEAWLKQASPGDRYPWQSAELLKEKWKFRQKRGGVISKRVSNGEVFARLGAKATDPVKGDRAEALIKAIVGLMNQGDRISQLERTGDGLVLYRKEGTLHFIGSIEGGLEFPE